jgi:hypothetical protein
MAPFICNRGSGWQGMVNIRHGLSIPEEGPQSPFDKSADPKRSVDVAVKGNPYICPNFDAGHPNCSRCLWFGISKLINTLLVEVSDAGLCISLLNVVCFVSVRIVCMKNMQSVLVM